jgi:peptide-methionine (S)-S-oxide reductase
VISYESLLEIFWQSHNPVLNPWSCQYMTAIFFGDEEQRKRAMESLERVASTTGRRIYTQVLPLERFYRAEDYHQKYRLQQDRELTREFRSIYPEFRDFVDSTAVARVNGYLSGYGHSRMLREESKSLGLSPLAERRLVKHVEIIGKR